MITSVSELRARRRLRISWFLVVVVFALLSAGGASAQTPTPDAAEADQADASAKVDIEVLSEASAMLQPNLVRIRVSTNRAFSGTLEVGPESPQWQEFDEILPEYRWELDLAANTDVETFALVPPNMNSEAIVARLYVDGEEVDTDRESHGFFGGGPAARTVGALGVETDLRVQLIGANGRSKITQLTPGIISSQALESFATIAADPETVQSLDDETRQVLAEWLRGGGQLALPNGIEDLGAAGLGDIDAERTGSIVGDGIVASLGGRDRLVDDQLVVNADSQRPMWFGPVGSTISPVGSLVDRAELRFTSLRGLSILLGLYIVVAGPLIFVVMRRVKNAKVVWVALPISAIAFTGLASAVAVIERGGGHEEQTSIIVSKAHGSAATTYVVARDSAKLELPADWFTAAHPSDWQFQQGPGSLVVDVHNDRLVASPKVGPGSAALLVAAGSVPDFDGGLTTTVTSQGDDQITGTVTNNLTVDLHQAIVVWGDGHTVLDDLPAGTTREFEITYKPMQLDPWGPPGMSPGPELEYWGAVGAHETTTVEGVEGQVWIDGPGGGPIPAGVPGAQRVIEPPPDGSTTDGNVWSSWRDNGLGPSTEDPFVAGWTDELPSPVGGVDGGRTAVFASVSASRAPGIRQRNITDAFDGEWIDAGPRGPGLLVNTIRVDVAEPMSTDEWGLEVADTVAMVQFITSEGTSTAKLEEGGGKMTIGLPSALEDETSFLIAFASPEGIASNNGGGPTLVASPQKVTDVSYVANDERIIREVAFQAFEEQFGVPGIEASSTELTGIGSSPDDDVVIDGELTDGAYDSYLFDATADTELAISMERQNGDCDPYLELRDPGGASYANNDDAGGSLDAGLEVALPVGGTWEIRASSFLGACSYTLSVDTIASGEEEPGE